MKKIFMLTALCLTSGISFVSCSDDDGPTGPSSESVTETAKISDFGGVRLSSIGDGYGSSTSFGYNNEGAINSITDGNNGLRIDYQKGIATVTEDGFTQNLPFSLDNQGRLTRISYSGRDEDGPYSLEYTMSYNEAGHLIQLNYHDDSDGGLWQEDETVVYTWEGDLLTKCEVTETEKEGDNVNTRRNTYTFSYANALENKFMQYTQNLINNMSVESSFSALLYIGVLGKGPAKYPTRIVSEWNQYDITYTLNSRGLVEKEAFNASEYSGTTVYNYSETKK